MIHQGDALTVLRGLEAESVHCCVTSPPYWGLRDYGVDGQLGLESTPEEYVGKLVEVFREVRRVLRGDGTLWLNLGDSYAGSGKGAWDTVGVQKEVYVPKPGGRQAKLPKVPPGLKPKDLVGIPWRVAFALQQDGWYLRSDIVWSKPNPMPESVTDRPTKAHEMVFLLSKSARYWWDADAVREEATSRIQQRWTPTASQPKGAAREANGVQNPTCQGGTGDSRNVRSVWEIATQPYSGAHYAVMPIELARRCIKAGCQPGGTVLDPFMGAGTTAIAAEREGRDWLGIELSPESVLLAKQRLHEECPRPEYEDDVAAKSGEAQRSLFP